MSELIEVMVDEAHILHYAVNENGDRCYIIQTDTHIKYVEAVDVYPTYHTYEATDEIIESDEGDIGGTER